MSILLNREISLTAFGICKSCWGVGAAAGEGGAGQCIILTTSENDTFRRDLYLQI